MHWFSLPMYALFLQCYLVCTLGTSAADDDIFFETLINLWNFLQLQLVAEKLVEKFKIAVMESCDTTSQLIPGLEVLSMFHKHLIAERFYLQINCFNEFQIFVIYGCWLNFLSSMNYSFHWIKIENSNLRLSIAFGAVLYRESFFASMHAIWREENNSLDANQCSFYETKCSCCF